MCCGLSREAESRDADRGVTQNGLPVTGPIATIRAFRSDPSHKNSKMDVGLRGRSGITYPQYDMVRLPGASAMSASVTIMNPMVMTSAIGSSRSVASSMPTRGSACARHRHRDARASPGNTEQQRRYSAKGDPIYGERMTPTHRIEANETGCVNPDVGMSAALNACPVLARKPVRAWPVCFPDGRTRGRVSRGATVLFRRQGKWMKRIFRAAEEIVLSGPTR
jgi:hypothetical protein